MNDYDRIEMILRHLMANFRDQPSLSDLAELAGLSEAHFHRLFRRFAGTTPKSFLQFLTATHAKRMLQESRHSLHETLHESGRDSFSDTLQVSLASGLSGPSRLHDLMIKVVALTPGEVRKFGAGIEIRYGFHATPFGECLLGATERGVCHLSFVSSLSGLSSESLESPNREDLDESKFRKAALDELSAHWPEASLIQDRLVTRELVDKIFGTRKSSSSLHLLLRGSSFQIKVWESLLRIPPGHVLSYSDVARLIDSPKASRAVGSAIAKNSIGYVIPCHRVIRESGHFGSYRWDETRKLAILGHEFSRRLGAQVSATDAATED